MSKDFSKTVVYSALEVANICGVANQTAINWIRSGYLKAYSTPGGQYRVYADNLLAFMAERDMRIPEELAAVCKKYAAQQQNILIVEDDEGLNSVLASYLTKQLSSVEILQAFDGFEAGALLANKRPKVIILDLNLPGVDGFELCRKINSSDEFGHPSVIVITALQDTDIEQRVAELQVASFLRKPLALPELAQIARECLDR
ncbi:response regulator [Treponema brennaborense]|uniref:Response regulator receiver protein n=1 Tax=Treponema brennaborense (strain DSM 12168 / CIP 105900 / DD5/3) TaxID=906968 RepID=F4LPY7_TREBD|nr:response regulator [Treponema brennaborense]AEE16079.1 response regulator receiver protein [Treponema brennaborense DSM 12168]